MDPIAAKGLGGLGGLGGQPAGGVAQKGQPGKFEAVRTEKLLGPGDKADVNKMATNFFQTGKMDAVKTPSMAERVAMRDGISFPGVSGMQGVDQAWRPNAVQATGKTESVAGAIKDLNSGQQRLDSIIGELRSGKEFTQAEMIGMQAEVNILSEQIQMSTKLVDSAMQSLKQVMQQQA
jgi:hypothetical protein